MTDSSQVKQVIMVERMNIDISEALENFLSKTEKHLRQ